MNKLIIYIPRENIPVLRDQTTSDIVEVATNRSRSYFIGLHISYSNLLYCKSTATQLAYRSDVWNARYIEIHRDPKAPKIKQNKTKQKVKNKTKQKVKNKTKQNNKNKH